MAALLSLLYTKVIITSSRWKDVKEPRASPWQTGWKGLMEPPWRRLRGTCWAEGTVTRDFLQSHSLLCLTVQTWLPHGLGWGSVCDPPVYCQPLCFPILNEVKLWISVRTSGDGQISGGLRRALALSSMLQELYHSTDFTLIISKKEWEPILSEARAADRTGGNGH